MDTAVDTTVLTVLGRIEGHLGIGVPPQPDDDGPDPLIKAAMAHLNLTLIHPFEDGNGRMARCLQSFVLAQNTRHPHFMSIEEDLGRRTSDYYRALQDTAAGSWSPARSTRPWIEWCLTAHLRQAHRTRWRLDWTEALWSACEDAARDCSCPSARAGATGMRPPTDSGTCAKRCGRPFRGLPIRTPTPMWTRNCPRTSRRCPRPTGSACQGRSARAEDYSIFRENRVYG